MRLVVLAFALAVSAPLAGCLSCANQLDVHHCRAETGRCDTQGEVVVDWNPDIAGLFPDVGRLVEEVGVGLHGHAAWSDEQMRTFWLFYDVPLDREDKQVYLRHDGKLFHVRILEC